MRRVLIYQNRKCPEALWDASTPELEAGSFLALFRELDTNWRVYEGLSEPPYIPERPESHPDGCMCDFCVAYREAVDSADREKTANKYHLALYKKAKKGSADAARALLRARKTYEYEEWRIASVEEETAKYSDEPTFGTPDKPCNRACVTETGLIAYVNHGRPSFRLHSSEKVAREGLIDRGRWKKVSSRKAKRSDSIEILSEVHPDHDVPKDVVVQYPVGKVVLPKRITTYVMVVCSTHERERDRFLKAAEE